VHQAIGVEKNMLHFAVA